MDSSIPCKICSDKSAGIHYGVPSCEACKSFFKRCNLKPPETNKCRNPGYCTIVPARRNNCAECRYMKCLAVGMSINNIKTGRYSAKQLEESRREAEKLQRQRELEKNGFYVNHRLNTEEIESIIKKLVETRLTMRENFDPQLGRFKKWAKFSTLSRKIPQGEHLAASCSFRRPEFLKNLVIQVTQDIPGFASLKHGDQDELIKTNRIDFRMIYNIIKVDDNGKFIVINDEVICSVEDFRRTENISEASVEKIRTIRNKLKTLNLTDEERVLLSSLTLTHTDRSMKIEDKVSIEKIQNNLLQCLEYYVEKHYGIEKGKRVAKLLTILADLRSCTDDLIQSKHNLLIQYPDIDFPPGVREMWYSDLQEAYDMDKIRSELKNMDIHLATPNLEPELDNLNDLAELEEFIFDASLFPEDIDSLFK